MQGPSESGPSGFEFQADPSQSDLTNSSLYPAASITAVGQKRGRGRPRKTLSLPAASSSLATPLVESTVRRSSRVSKAKGGFHTATVRLEEEPSKKRNKLGAVLIDEETGKAGPIPIEILQGWGIDCGIAPSELSQEALMQAPSSAPVINEDTTE